MYGLVFSPAEYLLGAPQEAQWQVAPGLIRRSESGIKQKDRGAGGGMQ